jgi:septal ring factor EnvC (AmiA/AmiB activator)
MAAKGSKGKRRGRGARAGLAAVSRKPRRPGARAARMPAQGWNQPASIAGLRARLERSERRVASLERKIARLETERTAEKQAERRRLANARRRFEARLTRMVQEIGQLRLHEARARALERMLAERGFGTSPVPNAAGPSVSRVLGREPTPPLRDQEPDAPHVAIDPRVRRP